MKDISDSLIKTLNSRFMGDLSKLDGTPEQIIAKSYGKLGGYAGRHTGMRGGMFGSIASDLTPDFGEAFGVDLNKVL